MSAKNGKPCKRCGGSEWYANGTCKPCGRLRTQQWNRENPEKRRELDRRNRNEYHRRYYANNTERRKEQGKKSRERNPDGVKEAQRRWLRKNPDKHVAQIHKRRTKKAENGGSYTANEWRGLCDYYENKCLCCGRGDVFLTVDHVLPVDLGGSSDISNIQPLCKPCNSRKSNRHIDYRNRPALLRWIQRTLFD